MGLPTPLNGELLPNELIQIIMTEKCKTDRNQTKANAQKPGMWQEPNEDLIWFNSISSPSFQKIIWRSVNVFPTIPYQIFLMQNKPVKVNLLMMMKTSTRYCCPIHMGFTINLFYCSKAHGIHLRTSTRPTQCEESLPLLNQLCPGLCSCSCWHEQLTVPPICHSPAV